MLSSELSFPNFRAAVSHSIILSLYSRFRPPPREYLNHFDAAERLTGKQILQLFYFYLKIISRYLIALKILSPTLISIYSAFTVSDYTKITRLIRFKVLDPTNKYEIRARRRLSSTTTERISMKIERIIKGMIGDSSNAIFVASVPFSSGYRRI